MNEEVGMYVRTDMGIGKVIVGEIIDFGIKGKSPIRYRTPIDKSSHNLIDLIEVGDYVNGEIVKEVYIADELNEKDSCIEILEEYLYVDDIKEILTHEQYEANCYKVGNKK